MMANSSKCFMKVSISIPRTPSSSAAVDKLLRLGYTVQITAAAQGLWRLLVALPSIPLKRTRGAGSQPIRVSLTGTAALKILCELSELSQTPLDTVVSTSTELTESFLRPLHGFRSPLLPASLTESGGTSTPRPRRSKSSSKSTIPSPDSSLLPDGKPPLLISDRP